MRWRAWRWATVTLAAFVVGAFGALAINTLGRGDTAPDTEMAAARAKAISVVRTRARNACNVSVSHRDLDQCVREVRAINFTAKALTAPEQEDAVRIFSEGRGAWLVRKGKGVGLVRQDEGLWLVREHVPGRHLAAYDSCWVVDPEMIEPEDLPLDGWTRPGLWHGGCSPD